jgi:hypothetical protein
MTLTEYANAHFPNHVTDQTGDDLTLTDHTAVAHVVGCANGIELIRRIRQAIPDADVGAVMIRPTDPTVLANGEDHSGAIDLPNRGVATAGLVAAIVIGAAAGAIVAITSGSAMIGVIVGVFAALLGGVVAAMLGGGSRLVGERPSEQLHAPDCTVAVIAAFADTEVAAVAATRVMDELDPYEVRIVTSDGAWHSPRS